VISDGKGEVRPKGQGCLLSAEHICDKVFRNEYFYKF